MAPLPSSRPVTTQVQREQATVDRLYRRLDERRTELVLQLEAVLHAEKGTAQARVERGATVSRILGLIAGVETAEHALCFGRLDMTDGSRRYLGRIGLRADDPDADPLLIDWRAPSARVFYTATAKAPQEVRLRRHLHTSGRYVRRLEDEVLDGTDLPDDAQLCGEAALLAALRSPRTGRMRDAVATLQTEQDRIIRSPASGVLVVQGTPGTGKTVVALHRAAYLLYSQQQLQKRGVLVVAPTPVFHRYIEQVLPGLGETAALLASVGELFPGVTARRDEPPAVSRIKGRLDMVAVVAAAVRDREGAVREPVEITISDERIRLDPQMLTAAADRARATGRPHNQARETFRGLVVRELARRMARVIADIEEHFEHDLADRIDSAALDRAALRDLRSVFGPGMPAPDPGSAARAELAEREEEWRSVLPRNRAVRELLDRLWPALTPERLLTELFGDRRRLAAAAPGLSPADRELLHRSSGQSWSTADVPLLDEAAEILGEMPRRQGDRGRAERAERAAGLAYARGVLEIAYGSRAPEDDDPAGGQRLNAVDLVTAADLAGWQVEADLRTVAERAASDRTWRFGHVIVDEAQELSPMTWRLLARRCPTRSFTIVGDMAQGGDYAGSRSWTEALEPHFGRHWRLEELTVNYRTPAPVMSASEPLQRAIAPDLRTARAVRVDSDEPVRVRTAASTLLARLADLAAEELQLVGDGRLAVIVPSARALPAVRAVVERLPGVSWGDDPDLEQPVVVLTVRQAKGLEFDSVLVVDPQTIIEESERGLNDLYVAMTRSSGRLVVVHPGPVPPVLAHLRERAAVSS